MNIIEQKLDYYDQYNPGNQDKTRYAGVIAYDNSFPEKRPAVLVVHDWTGQNAFSLEKARKIAELGYIGFAVDMYGEGRNGRDKEEKMALIKPLMEDRILLRQRLKSALLSLCQLEKVDTQKIAVIGFCFGGLCALELARSGADILGAVSFHGLLHADSQISHIPIKSKILVLHGFDDPMVMPQEVLDFSHEMTQAKVDWQLQVYGNTMHAFTNPQADDKDFGTVYSKTADRRSWLAMKNFLAEIFE